MQLLPDLMPWMPENNSSAFNWNVQGNELRLTSAIANVGDGAMEIRGGATNNGVQEVFQRIYNDDGTFTEDLAGQFVHHAGHGHIHFEDFAEFRLREVNPDGSPGDIVATGDKVSFCLIDVSAHGLTPAQARDHLSCGQVQGISAGWADIYSQGLPGQSIDISNVSNGNYFLEIVADPLNQLVEADETNNVTRTQITIERDGGPVIEVGDAFENNDSFDEASLLAPPEDHLYENLSIHSSGNDDYYRVTASATGTMTLGINFQHSQGDVDMVVYDAQQNVIQTLESATDNESYTFEAVAGQDYFVKVYGYNGATNTNYTLVVDQPEGSVQEPSNLVNDVAGTTQFLDGDAIASDTFVINGNRADFNWGPTEDGTGVVVWSDTSHDILIDFDVIRFNDQEVALNATGPDSHLYNDVAGVTQYLNGNGDHDTFVIDGNSSNFSWAPTEDGTGVVVWNATTHDILTDFNHIQFTDVRIDLTSHGNGLIAADNPGATQFLTGTEMSDRFVIADNAENFGWGETEDGQGTVVWNNQSGAHDILYDFEEIAFNDQTVTLSDQLA